MKNFYITVFFILFSSQMLYTQFVIESFDNVKTLTAEPSQEYMSPEKPTKSAKSDFTRWYNYGEAMQVYHGMPGNVYDDILFPDTTILGTVGFGMLRTHKIADVLDVSSPIFNDSALFPTELKLGSLARYYLDSIAVHCIYQRNLLDTSIVDTLLIEVVSNANLNTVYFAPGSTVTDNLGVDTVFLRRVPYSHLTNRLDMLNKNVYKVPLTHQDYLDAISNNGEMVVKIATDDLPEVTPGRLIVTSVGFIPGYTWTPNVDDISTKNSLEFMTRKQRPNQFPHYIKHDYNISYTIPTDVRYNLAPGWNGLYIPSFAYMGGTTGSFPYEHHMIDYLIRSRFNISASYTKSFQCYGENHGYINLSVDGGTPPYEFIWSNGDTTQNLQNLTAGTYRVTITDADTVSAIRSYRITQPANPIQTTVTTDPASSCGASDGAINISNTQGGTPPYSVIILDSDSLNQSPAGLPAGIYTIKIIDANGCVHTTYVGISEIGSPILDATVNNVSCPGLTDGSIELNVVNPVGTPTFTWCTGQTSSSLSGLAAGSYIVTISDDGCMIYEVFHVIEPDPINISATINEPSHGAQNGIIILNISGGTPHYSYLWSTGETTKNIGGLGEGTYSVTVTDGNGCTNSKTFVLGNVSINEPDKKFSVHIYPNPATDKLFVEIENNYGNIRATYTLYSIHGRKVKNADFKISHSNYKLEIDIEDLKTGFYILELIIDKQRIVKKVIK